MGEIWAKINFSPTTFEPPEDSNEDEVREDTMGGDRPVKRVQEDDKK